MSLTVYLGIDVGSVTTKLALVDEKAAADLKIKLADTDIKVLGGMDGVCECAEIQSADTVLNSVVGMAGLKPTLTAIYAGKKIYKFTIHSL